jgi:multidrug efflux pump
MRSTLGIAVFSGMLGVTIFGVFFTPVFYYVIRWFTARKQAAPAEIPIEETNGEPAAKESDHKPTAPPVVKAGG